jgi:hypothetical protein
MQKSSYVPFLAVTVLRCYYENSIVTAGGNIEAKKAL